MRTSRLSVLVVLGVAVGSPALAQQERAQAVPRAVLAPSSGAAQPVPLSPFPSAREAVRAGVRNYNAGDKAGAVQALEFAAGHNNALALWKLGRMYSAGDGVPHDDLKAFEYFSKIADEFAEETPGTEQAAVVSSAFVALGRYFLTGIPNTYVKANPGRAFEMFQYAASYYGDPEAQFLLSRLYLDGRGVAADPRQAVRWVNRSADKGHVEAQALLGQLLMSGAGTPRQAARGLMWLTIARDGADPARNPTSSRRIAARSTPPRRRIATRRWCCCSGTWPGRDNSNRHSGLEPGSRRERNFRQRGAREAPARGPGRQCVYVNSWRCRRPAESPIPPMSRHRAPSAACRPAPWPWRGSPPRRRSRRR